MSEPAEIALVRAVRRPIAVALLPTLLLAFNCRVPLAPTPPGGEAPSASLAAECAADRTPASVADMYWAPGTFEPTGVRWAVLHWGHWLLQRRTWSSMPSRRAEDEWLRGWYSKNLCAMKEPPLAPTGNGQWRFRLLWAPSFDPNISVRLEKDGEQVWLVAAELDGAGGFGAWKVTRRVERPVDPVEWAGLESTIQESGFWTAPTTEWVDGLDGARWILEVADRERYHVVDRWSHPESFVHVVGGRMLALSGLDPESVY